MNLELWKNYLWLISYLRHQSMPTWCFYRSKCIVVPSRAICKNSYIGSGQQGIKPCMFLICNFSVEIEVIHIETEGSTMRVILSESGENVWRRVGNIWYKKMVIPDCRVGHQGVIPEGRFPSFPRTFLGSLGNLREGVYIVLEHSKARESWGTSKGNYH